MASIVPFDSDWLYSGAASSNIQSFANRVADISVQKGPNGESVMVAPIIGGDERVGSILFVRRSGDFSSQDIDIAHIASVTLGMIISRVIHERQEDKASQSRAARSAINSLSYSEILAMQRDLRRISMEMKVCWWPAASLTRPKSPVPSL